MFQNLFNYDNPVWRFIGKLGDMIILNVLWLLCCIPIITIGPATTAVYYCTLKIVRDEENGTIRMFVKSFKENLVQASIIWVIMALMGIVLGFDLFFFAKVLVMPNETLRFLAMSFTGAVFLIWLIILLYVFPIQSRFVNPVKRTFLNAFFMSVRHLGRTLLMLVQDAAILVLSFYALFYVPQIAGVCLLLGFPVIAWINSYSFEKIFERYMPEDAKHFEKASEEYLAPILEDESEWKDGGNPFAREDSSDAEAQENSKSSEDA